MNKKLLIPIVVILLLIITKPSKERCESAFEGHAKSRLNSELYKSMPPTYDTETKIEMTRKYSSGWRSYLSTKDYFLFRVIRYGNLDGKDETLGIGLLNTTFDL